MAQWPASQLQLHTFTLALVTTKCPHGTAMVLGTYSFKLLCYLAIHLVAAIDPGMCPISYSDAVVDCCSITLTISTANMPAPGAYVILAPIPRPLVMIVLDNAMRVLLRMLTCVILLDTINM